MTLTEFSEKLDELIEKYTNVEQFEMAANEYEEWAEEELEV